MTTATVVDVSSWQHPGNAPIDWGAVKGDGVVGAIVKLTQGTGYVNPYGVDDINAAAAAGLLTGAYHFCTPAASSPQDEAGHFLANLGGLELSLGVWVDVEDVGSYPLHELWGWVSAFLGECSTPQRPGGVYTDRSLYSNMIGAPGPYRLWLAVPGQTEGPAEGEQITQTGQQSIAGITGPVDVDTVWNTRGLNLPPGGTVTPTPPPPPPPSSDQPTQGGLVNVQVPQLQQGSSGWSVKALQLILRGHDANLSVDGEFGPLTEAAVKAFQEVFKVTADGIVGPVTWGLLLNGA